MGGHGDADRRRRLYLGALEREGDGQLGLQPLGDQCRLAGVLDPVDDHHELVTAEPGDEVGRADDRAQAAGHRHQQGITRPVTEGVVHRLEPVEIEEQEGGPDTAAPPAGQGAFEELDEQRPVGQTGERVVQGAVLAARPRCA